MIGGELENRMEKPEEISSYLSTIKPYKVPQDILAIAQQMYPENNRYVITATQTDKSIEADIFVAALLGIDRQLGYVPATTISAIVSQLSAVALWCKLRDLFDEPKYIFNQMIDRETVGFKRENHIYKNHMPLETTIHASIRITHTRRLNNSIIAHEIIELGSYNKSDILGYAIFPDS